MEDSNIPLLVEEDELNPNFYKKATGLFQTKKCLFCSSFCLVFSVLIAIAFPLIVQKQLKQGILGDVIIDSTNADGFAQFQDRGKEGLNYIEFNFFNITNPHQVLEGAKPKLEEIGPFCYTTFQHRGDFKWHEDQDTLEYREHMFYVFNKERTLEKTNGKFDTDKVKITTYNILFDGMKTLVGKNFWHIICDFLLWKNDYKRLFSQRTVLEYATGYKEEIELGFLKIPVPFPGLYPNLTRSKDPNWNKKTTMKVGKKKS